jgi:high-affinity iron transporter
MQNLAPAVWAGTLSALLVCVAAAVGLNALGLSLEDPGEAIFEGLTMLLAAGILTWMIFWMARQSRNIKADLESGVRQASRTGRRGLFALAFVAVLREGVELALFLTAASLASDARQTLTGAFLGLGTAALLGGTLFATTVRLDLRRFFQVTGVLLILFAAGLVARGVGELVEVGWIPALVGHVWDLGRLVSEDSAFGQVLGALFGYGASPSLAQVLAYAAYFGAVLLGLGAASRKPAEGTATTS